MFNPENANEKTYDTLEREQNPELIEIVDQLLSKKLVLPHLNLDSQYIVRTDGDCGYDENILSIAFNKTGDVNILFDQWARLMIENPDYKAENPNRHIYNAFQIFCSAIMLPYTEKIMSKTHFKDQKDDTLTVNALLKLDPTLGILEKENVGNIRYHVPIKNNDKNLIDPMLRVEFEGKDSYIYFSDISVPYAKFSSRSNLEILNAVKILHRAIQLDTPKQPDTV